MALYEVDRLADNDGYRDHRGRTPIFPFPPPKTAIKACAGPCGDKFKESDMVEVNGKSFCLECLMNSIPKNKQI